MCDMRIIGIAKIYNWEIDWYVPTKKASCFGEKTLQFGKWYIGI